MLTAETPQGYCFPSMGEPCGDCHRCMPPLCPTREPEPHGLGEFPMTCYRCHLEADA